MAGHNCLFETGSPPDLPVLLLQNMSALPESKLAREAEISYALVCTST